MYRVTSGKYIFWFTGKSVFIRIGTQNMNIINKSDLDLNPGQYAELCDLAYRRKVTKEQHLYDIMNRYKLVYTQRALK